MHALIIEDESMIAFAIEEILRDSGFTSFDVAASAHSAIVAATLRRPDMITSDVQLKPGCGIATVEIICRARAIPTIFITGNAADVARRLPNYRVLTKPFSERALIAGVAAAMLEMPSEDASKRVKPDSSFNAKAVVL